MQRRQQYLVIGLVVAIVLWQGGRMIDSTFLEPIRVRQNDLVELEKTLGQRKQEMVQLARQKKNLEKWRRSSLPPDPVKNAKQKPDALNALRLYQDWLHDLAQISGFEALEVKPERLLLSRDNVFVSVNVKIEAEAHFEQLCRFLDRFYHTDLLHRVTSLRIKSTGSEGDPLLSIVLEAEGLAIVGAPQSRRLFAQTTLDEELSEDGTEVTVESTEGFPEKPGFMLRMRSEFLKVTAIDGTTWTVERAQDSTTAASHPVGTIIERVRLDEDLPARTPDEFKHLVASNIFVKPAPPVQYKPRIATLAEKSVTRGKPIEFSIIALAYDPAKGRPEFSLLPPIIAGSKLDKSSGKFFWAPSKDQKAGKYVFKFEVKHPSAAGGRLLESVTVDLREPNLPPRIAMETVPRVYIGRPWTFTPKATDPESASHKLTWRLGEGAPAGLAIDSRSGEMTWTPDDSVEIGDVTVSVVVSDDGTPPQSTTQSLKLNVQDDAAMFTHLTTIFAVNGNILAKLYDRSRNVYTELRIGTDFTVADVHGTVTRIEKKYLVFDSGEQTHRLELGKSLREISTEKTAKPSGDLPKTDEPDEGEPADATQPTNAVKPKRDVDSDTDSAASGRDE